VLFYIGTGPVRGFAVTLGVGILTSLFTAFTLTRGLIVADLLGAHGRRPRTVPIIKMRSRKTLILTCAFGLLPHRRPDDTKFDFMRFRRISFPISALLSIVAITLFFTTG
jgi:preprotein translocase subunit SecF